MLRVDEVADSPLVPAEVDVVIIGGGIIGTTTAYELARQGVSVALVERASLAPSNRGATGAGSASRTAGMTSWSWRCAASSAGLKSAMRLVATSGFDVKAV